MILSKVKLLFLMCVTYSSLVLASAQSSHNQCEAEGKEDRFEIIDEYTWPTDLAELNKPLKSSRIHPSRVLYRRCSDGSGIETDGKQLVTNLCAASVETGISEPSQLPTVLEAKVLIEMQESKPLKVPARLLRNMFTRNNVTGFFYASEKNNGKVLARVHFEPLSQRDRELLGSLRD